MKFCVFLSGERGIFTLSHFLKRKLVPIEIYLTEDKREIIGKVSELVGGSINVKVVGDVNDIRFVDYLNSLSLDFGVVAGFPTIFKAELIKSTLYGMVNQHAGRLPTYRGGSPLNWQIINGERKIGISVIKMDEGIDSGQVLASAEFLLSVGEDISHAHMKANNLFGSLSIQAIDKLLSGNYSAAETIGDSVYWHQRNDADGLIHWDRMSAAEVVNLVRGVAPPYPGAFCFFSKQMIRVYRASVPDDIYRGTPGRVFFVQGKGPLVCARDKAVLLRDYVVQPFSSFENKSTYSILRTGDRLESSL
jgi:methionyl-tRNA formyltransferase